MLREEISDTIKKLVLEQLGIHESLYAEDISFEEMGADSLDSLELAMYFEEEFSMQFPDEDFKKLINPGRVVQYVVDKTENIKKEAIGIV